MLDVHAAEPLPERTKFICPQSELNFVSLMRMSRFAFPEHAGPLSVKCTYAGQESYDVGSRRLALEPGRYLILNEGQRYSSLIESDEPVESFCVWFRPGFAESVLSGLITPHDKMLDDPFSSDKQPIVFHERVVPDDDLVSPIIRRMRDAVADGHVTQPWLEDQFHVLLERMLQAHREVYTDIARMPAARPATRSELYRRLNHAKDYLDSTLDAQVPLIEVASIACMGPHHCLRMFKKAFGETPHQYHVRRRLEQAQRLLRSTDRSVTRICQDVGFESLGSFSWLFRRQFGVSPSGFRTIQGLPQPPGELVD